MYMYSIITNVQYNNNHYTNYFILQFIKINSLKYIFRSNLNNMKFSIIYNPYLYNKIYTQ